MRFRPWGAHHTPQDIKHVHSGQNAPSIILFLVVNDKQIQILNQRHDKYLDDQLQFDIILTLTWNDAMTETQPMMVCFRVQ